MTDNTKNNVPAAPAKEGIGSKVIGGLSWWINSLTGKPQPRKVSTPAPVPSANQPEQKMPDVTPVATTATNLPAGVQTGGEDSVAADLNKLKGLVKKLSGDVSKTVTPVVSKGVEVSAHKATEIGRKNSKFLSLAMKIFFVVLLLIVLGFVGMQFLKKSPEIITPPDEEPTTESTATPTPLTFEPTKPSVYADDPEILKLEKDLEVLVREIGGTNIKENNLNPPVMDYNVSF